MCWLIVISIRICAEPISTVTVVPYAHVHEREERLIDRKKPVENGAQRKVRLDLFMVDAEFELLPLVKVVVKVPHVYYHSQMKGIRCGNYSKINQIYFVRRNLRLHPPFSF